MNTTKTRTAKAAEQAVNGKHVEQALAANIEMPSYKRQLIASVANLLSFSASMYWGLQLAGWLMTAAIVYTSSSFLAFVIGVVAIILSFRAAWKTGAFLGDLILNFDGTDATNLGRELRVAAAKKVSVMKSWFKREDDQRIAV